MWEDNIKIYLRERGCGGMDWIHMAQDGSYFELFSTFYIFQFTINLYFI
jgi:hypothetical protein